MKKKETKDKNTIHVEYVLFLNYDTAIQLTAKSPIPINKPCKFSFAMHYMVTF